MEETAVFSPGVTFNPAESRFKAWGTLSDCVSSDPTITSGVITAHGRGTFSCAVNDELNARAREVIEWNNGRSSVLEAPVAVGFGPADAFVAYVVGGSEFVGVTMRAPAAFQAEEGSCASDEGVTRLHLTQVSTFS